MSPFRLAVSAEMVFLDLPFTDRVRRIAEILASRKPRWPLVAMPPLAAG